MARQLMLCISLAGRGYSPQQMISALLPHMQFIQDLKGGSLVNTPFDSFLRLTQTRWEMFWQCLPNLKHLDWTVPSCAFETCGPDEALGLPDNLSSLDLVVYWDHGEHGNGALTFNISRTLEARHWHEKMSCLAFETYRDPDDHTPGDIHFGEESWPILHALSCTGSAFHGTLNAPNLTVIDLEIGPHPVIWKVFDSCQSLTSITVEGERQLSTFDCRSCTFPSTLKELFLSVGQVREDGWFTGSHGLNSLHSLHVSFVVDYIGTVNLGAFASGSKAVSITMEDGIFNLTMPQ